jgi:hypothetical protein
MLVPHELYQMTGAKCKDSVKGKATFSIKLRSHKVGKHSSMKGKELAQFEVPTSSLNSIKFNPLVSA